MIKLIILSTFFSLFNYGVSIDTSAADGWSFVKEEHGVKLYNRAISGFEFKEVKAVLHVKTDLTKAKNYLLNPNNIEKWMSGCSMSIAKKSNGNTREYYTIFDAPWPISDRDDYGMMELKESSSGKLHIDFKSVPNGTPKVSSMVRVPYSRGNIIIETNGKGDKILIYQMLVDRGGSLPNYVKDHLENTSPVHTVQKLKIILQNL
jgi:hypothetical protein